jgi:hypothetical protein
VAISWGNNFPEGIAVEEGVRVDDFNRNRNFDPQKLKAEVKPVKHFRAAVGGKNNLREGIAGQKFVWIDDFDRNRNFKPEKLTAGLKSRKMSETKAR